VSSNTPLRVPTLSSTFRDGELLQESKSVTAEKRDIGDDGALPIRMLLQEGYGCDRSNGHNHENAKQSSTPAVPSPDPLYSSGHQAHRRQAKHSSSKPNIYKFIPKLFSDENAKLMHGIAFVKRASTSTISFLKNYFNTFFS